jgi:hypothetical protein
VPRYGLSDRRYFRARRHRFSELGNTAATHHCTNNQILESASRNGCTIAAVFGGPRSDEASAKFILSTGAMGNVTTQTMKAFTEGEYRKIVASL